MSKVALVAALEREVRPLVRRWDVKERDYGGRRFRFFERGDAVAICGGIGQEAARRASEAIIGLYTPEVIYSVGFAGALEPRLNVGAVVRPVRVINAADGSSVVLDQGDGVLLSFGSVAGAEQKSKLHAAFLAAAVDMEAAAVARAAEMKSVRFGAIKVISDEVGFEIPGMERFVDSQGKFLELRFAVFASLRPWLWVRLWRLMGNSGRAARILCEQLDALLERSAETYSQGAVTSR
ncbi:MAG TPA: hypothetical protein VKV39_10210 [Candidatus Sulfotelmatobacter sp.]|nr:hypothetical protein [Candidatus Sulfotelmatobacter sp.]